MKPNQRDDGLEAAKLLVLETYLVMLCLPHSSPLRIAAQSTMAKCVDFLAHGTGLDPEHIQNECEAYVAREMTGVGK